MEGKGHFRQERKISRGRILPTALGEPVSRLAWLFQSVWGGGGDEGLGVGAGAADEPAIVVKVRSEFAPGKAGMEAL